MFRIAPAAIVTVSIIIVLLAGSCVHTSREVQNQRAYPEPTITVGISNSDFTSIQEAVNDPRTAEGDIIEIIDSVHTEEGITISKNIIIQGSGPDKNIVQAHEDFGAAENRVFLIEEGFSVTIRGITVRHGNTTECKQTGGGIYNKGTLVLESCIITENSSSSGGGIANSGTLTIVESIISSNSADGRGGDGTRGSGGGIKSGAGLVRIINSRIEYNKTSFRGGGLKIGCGSDLDLINCIVHHNTARVNGGGIHLKGSAIVTGCTITDNNASDAGGIMNDGRLSIFDSIVTGNSTALKWGAGDLLTGDEGVLEQNIKNEYDDMR